MVFMVFPQKGPEFERIEQCACALPRVHVTFYVSPPARRRPSLWRNSRKVGGVSVMSHLGVSTADLRQLCAVVDKDHLNQPGDTLPVSVLEALRELVPCDDITYQVMDPVREIFLECYELYGNIPYLETDESRLHEFFWQTFRTSPSCNYPQRTGDFTTVRRASDFYSAREFGASVVGELHRLQGVRHEILIPLPPDGDIDHRIILWRADGPDFSDREQLLLTRLRPALAELELALRLRRSTPMTARQSQLLDLVADGMTNRQIASRLHLSEGTVRRHLENIFERLGVNNRAAAATHVVRMRSGAGHLVPIQRTDQEYAS
jgi:DNA-binding CsgD family transcriptional regulator